MTPVRKAAARVEGCWVPTPPEIEQASELAILAAVDSALQTTDYALIAAHPELCAQDEPHQPLSRRVGALVASGAAHGTVLVLFTHGSSGRRVVAPVAGRFATRRWHQ
jgi:hypothetical protein